MTPNEEKDAMRKFFLEKRKSISKQRRKIAQDKVMTELYPQLMNFKLVLSFASFRDEIDLWILNDLLASEKRLVLPRIVENGIKLYRVTHFEEELIASKWTLLEPNPEKCKEIRPSSLDCMLVPALGFDQRNYRLGYGKGHYDRFLEKHNHCPTYGVGFTEQLINDPLPTENHDQKLSRVYLF